MYIVSAENESTLTDHTTEGSEMKAEDFEMTVKEDRTPTTEKTEPMEMASRQGVNNSPKGSTLNKGENEDANHNKKMAVKASVEWTRPERKSRKR